MTNTSKQKGTSWETAIVNYLVGLFFRATRIVLHGREDHGDVLLETESWRITIEAKNERKITLSSYVDEAVRESANAGTDLGVAWVHRRGKSSPADGYVVMRGQDFMKLAGT